MGQGGLSQPSALLAWPLSTFEHLPTQQPIWRHPCRLPPRARANPLAGSTLQLKNLARNARPPLTRCTSCHGLNPVDASCLQVAITDTCEAGILLCSNRSRRRLASANISAPPIITGSYAKNHRRLQSSNPSRPTQAVVTALQHLHSQDQMRPSAALLCSTTIQPGGYNRLTLLASRSPAHPGLPTPRRPGYTALALTWCWGAPCAGTARTAPPA